MVWHAPHDYLQGIYAKIMYLHVPMAWLSMMYYMILATCSALFLAVGNRIYNIIAINAAKIGITATISTLITGAMWGKPTWGAYWVWDARLTSVLLLALIYFAYLLILNTPIEEQKRNKNAAIFALIGLINIPIIKFSVNLWNTLHQGASVWRLDGPTIHQSMLWPLLMMFIAWLCCSLYLLLMASKKQLKHFKSC